MAENQSNREGAKTVYVDDQPVMLDESELTIRRLLELAGTPADVGGQGEAVLRELRNGQEIKHEDLEETIMVSEEARFYTRNATPGGSGQETEPFQSKSTTLETGATPKADVNTSTFGASTRATEGQPRNETRGGFQPGSPPTNVSQDPQRTQNVGGSQQSSSGSNVGGRPPTPDASTQRGPVPGQGVPNPKFGVQQGSSMHGNKGAPAGAEKTRQGFNEGEEQQPGSRRAGERKEGRPGERKTEEPET